MKKLLLFLLLLPFVGLSQTLNIWYIENDTTTLGITYKVYVKGQAQNPTDTGRIYMNINPTTQVTAFKMKLYDIDNLPVGPDDTREISFTVPLSAKTGVNYVKSNYEGVQYPVFVRSNTVDITTGAFGQLSGFEGFSTFIKIKYTYNPQATDSIELYLDGNIYMKIAVSDTKNDSLVTFSLPVIPGVYRLTSNYLFPTAFLDYTVNQTNTTSIVEIYDPGLKRSVVYYDILGRVTTPKEGDFIRYTAHGAIVF